MLGPAQDGADAGREFARAERLGHVVVRSEFEARDAVVGVRFRGEHDDRNGRGGGIVFELPADILPPHLGKHQVEDDHVGRRTPGGSQTGQAIGGQGDGKTGLLQVVAQQVANILLVLNQENLIGFLRYRRHAGGR